MNGDYVGSRREFLLESWDMPSLDEIRILKNSAEWESLSEHAKKMYNTMEKCMTRSEQPLNADGEPESDSVEVELIKLHGSRSWLFQRRVTEKKYSLTEEFLIK